MAKKDPSIPVVFDFPDGDQAALITWEFVLKELNTRLEDMLSSMSAINLDLQRIDTRLAEFVPNESE